MKMGNDFNDQEINTKEKFAVFLELFLSEYRSVKNHLKWDNDQEWVNDNLEHYLESMSAYAEIITDMYSNNNWIFPGKISWNFYAFLLFLSCIKDFTKASTAQRALIDVAINVDSKEGFVNFIFTIYNKLRNKDSALEITDLETFYKSLIKHVNYYENAFSYFNISLPEGIEWSVFANLIIAARYYE